MLEHLISTIAECQLNSEKLRLQVNPKTAFRLLTKDNEITGEDIRNFMDVTDGELEHILSFLDFDQDQHISYQDFAQATSSLEPTRQALLQLLRQEAINYNRLQILKQQLDPEILLSELDTENKGFITKRTLQNNCNLPLNTLNAFFRALDHKKDGKIYYGPLSIKYTELRKSQEKERQILHESRSLQQKLLIHDTEYQKMRLKQIQQCIQSRLNLERIKDPNSLHYQTLLKVRQQIQQIDYIRRNSQRDLFQRSLKHEQGILKDLNTLKIETAQKCKHLSSMHDQLYTMRTQQDTKGYESPFLILIIYMNNQNNAFQQDIEYSLKQPTDKQQIAYYARLADQLNDIAINNKNDPQKTVSTIQQMIILPFPTNTHQLLCNSLSMIIASLNNQLLTKVIESILQQLNKKGFILKQLALPLLVNIVTMPQDIPTISFQLSQDIGTAILKLLKNSECRLPLTKTFRFISQYFAQDVLKYSIKFTQNEKSKPLREAGLQSLIHLMKKNENLTSYAETIINLAFRQEDSNLQYKLIRAFLPHQDVLQTFVSKKNEKSKILKPVTLTQKEEITKIFQIFNTNLSKFPSNMLANIILCYRKYLSTQLEKYGLVICRGGFEIATSCLGRLSSDELYIHQIYKAGCQLGIHLIHLLQEKDKEEMIEYFFEKIKKNNYKNQVHILKLLLKGLNTIFDGLSNYDGLYIEKLQVVFSTQEVTLRTLTIQSPLRASVNRNIYSILQTLFLENKKWQQNILSALLNHAKISIAELSVNETPQLQQTLSTQCICSASLFKLLDVNLHSIPQELINQFWEISKQFIIHKQTPLLIKTGWIIMAELMMVPYFASQNKLKEILVLIQQVLKDMPTEISEDQLNQFRAIGLVSISLINGQQFKSLSDSMRKFLAQQLILFFQALTNSSSKLDRSLPVLMSAKYILFQALRLLNPKHYASHLNALVQFSVEEALLSTTVYQDVNFWKPNHYFDEQVGDVRSELQLAIATMKFLGYIMATNSFTIKNKVNFIKYLHGNLVQVKDKPQKLQVYLFALHQIALKIQHLQVSDEFNEQIFAMIDLCWNSDCQVIQKLSAQVYCLLLKDNNKEEQLNKLLSSKQPPHGTLIYLIIEILERKITQIDLQIQNLFMKVVSHLSMNQEDFIKLAFQLFQRVDSSLLKNSFVFIVFSMMKDNNQIKLPNTVLYNYLKTGGQPNNYYQMLQFECRCASQFKPFEMLKLQPNNEKVYPLIEKYLTSKNLPKLLEILQYFQTDTNLDIHRLIIYLNGLFKMQKAKSSQIEIDIRSKMKSLIVKSFNVELDSLLLLIQPYILGEFIGDDKSNKIHIRTRIFLLKRLQKLFQQFTNITLVFDFLFKIVTSNYDETKELSFKMFEYFFKSISKEPEQVINFAAQIDSIVSDTIRRESQNSPNVNLVNMKILSKFVKIINPHDKNLSIKLLNLLIKPIFKKMIPSQFYSEKSQSNLFIQRFKSLASIYLNDPSIFVPEQVEQLKQCVEELLQDIFIILCTPRPYLREHKHFNYFYSGKKHYYDSQNILQSLPKLLKISALNSKLHCSLIGFVITESSPLEHIQNYYAKLKSSMSVETVEQMKKYKIKGINLLFQILGMSPNLIMQGIEDLMPLMIEIAPLNRELISKLYHQLSIIFLDKIILQPYIQAIIISTQEIYTICDNSQKEIKQQCLSTLFNFLKSGEESERIIQTHWDYLMNSNYNFTECKEYVNRIGKIQNLNEQLSTICTNILEQLDQRQFRQEDYYLTLQLTAIIRNEEQLILLNQIVSKQFLEFIKQAAKLFTQQKCVDSIILQLLIPIIQVRIQQNQNESIEIIQFFLLVFILHQQKEQIFLQMVKVLLLFVDPKLNQQIVQTAQNALKHMISITNCSSDGFPPKLKMIVDALRAQNNREMYEYIQHIKQGGKTIKSITDKTDYLIREYQTEDVWIKMIVYYYQHYMSIRPQGSQVLENIPEHRFYLQQSIAKVPQFMAPSIWVHFSFCKLIHFTLQSDEQKPQSCYFCYFLFKKLQPLIITISISSTYNSFMCISTVQIKYINLLQIMNQQVIWQSTSQENNLISNNSQHSSNYDSKYIGKEDIQDNRNNRILGMSYNSNSNSNSNSKERCKTDPDSDSEIKKQRKVVKNFIQESQQKLKDNQKLLKQDLDLQSERIHNRIKNRRYSKPMLKSSSCEVYFSKEYKSECTSVADTTSIVDTEDFEDQLQEDIVLELDIQRDEKIYRIVRHYNNQIDNLRALKMDDDTLKIMVDLERKKWEEIEIIQVQYDQIKLEQSTIRKQ